MTYEEERAAIRQLALLCLEERVLTDEELSQISDNEQKVSSYLRDRAMFASGGVHMTLRARARRKKLNELSTTELQRRMDEIEREHSRALAEDIDDEEDDSLYMAPPFDSDAHIISELLKERNPVLK